MIGTILAAVTFPPYGALKIEIKESIAESAINIALVVIFFVTKLILSNKNGCCLKWQHPNRTSNIIPTLALPKSGA